MAPGVHDQVGGFAIQRVTILMQLPQPRFGVCGAQERAVTVLLGALPKVRRLRTQVDNIAGGPKRSPIGRVEHGAAAGCQHNAAASCEFRDDLRFALAKADLTLDFEYHRHLDTGTRLDFVIGVEKRPSEMAGQQTPYGRLSGTHQADQIKVLRFKFHNARL